MFVCLIFVDPRIDPTAKLNEALMECCKYGKIEIVKLLLQGE